MLRFNRTELRILEYLYEKNKKGEPRPYLTEMARDIGTTKAVVSDNIKKLRRDNLIESEKKGPLKFYKLSAKGEALAWALLNPDALADLYETEETAESIGVRLPKSLSDFYNEAQSLTVAEESLLREYAQGKITKLECSRRFFELKKIRDDLSKRFENSRGMFIKEIKAGGIPYAAISRLESFEDLIFLLPLIMFSDLDRKIEGFRKIALTLRSELSNTKNAITGLQKMLENGILTKKELSERKSLYEEKMQRIQQLLDKIKGV
jgi:DNA-binding MarR family transcriptional regulator